MELIGEGAALTSYYCALGAIEPIAKTETADTGRYTYNYVNFEAVLAEVKRACELFKLAPLQEMTHDGELFAVVTTLLHQDGSMVRFAPTVLPMPREAQPLGSAASYLKRYALMTCFAIPTPDDDGKEATVAAQTSPGRRTEAERLIREAVSEMDEPLRKRFTADFRTQFGVGLSDLVASKHGDALTWSREWARARKAEMNDAEQPEPAGAVT